MYEVHLEHLNVWMFDCVTVCLQAHSVLSDRSSDSQARKKAGASPSSPHTDTFPVVALATTSSVADKNLPSSTCLSPDPSTVLSSPRTPASLLNGDLQTAKTEKAPKDPSPCLPALECEYLSLCSSSSKTINQSPSLSPSVHAPGTSFSPTPGQVQPTSWTGGIEEMKSVDRSASGELSDLPEQKSTVVAQRNNDDTQPALACQTQHGINVKTDEIVLDTFQMNEKQRRNEQHSSSVPAQEAYNSHSGSPAALLESFTSAAEDVKGQTEMDALLSCTLHEEISAKTKGKGAIEVSQNQVTHTESGELHNRAEGNPNNPTDTERLDVAFETSVDASDTENVDVDAFLQQLDTEGRVYWAEPIQLYNPTPEASGSFEASDGSPGNQLVDSFSSTSKALSLPPSSSANTDGGQNSAAGPASSSLTAAAVPNIKPSTHSVSVQMSSYVSSHIVSRKDVPFVAESKHTRLPPTLPLDTSTPFRAVQSWTDLQIQRSALTKNLSYGSLHAVASKANVSMSCPGMTYKSTHPEIFSSSPSFFLLSTNWKSQDTIPEVAVNSETQSVDTEWWPDRQDEEVNRAGSKSDKKPWEGQTVACCCSCDLQCSCCTHRGHNKESTVRNSTVSNTRLYHFSQINSCCKPTSSLLTSSV